VSSHSWDVNGAAAFGLTTFWVPRQPQDAPDELGYKATKTLESMAELAPLLMRR
jgi:FMN phosphatase YigB (HAD superfamily)